MGGNLYTETTEKSTVVTTTPTATETVTTPVTAESVPTVETTGTTTAVGGDTAAANVVPPLPPTSAQ